MPCNTYLLIRIKAAIHRQCHEILTSYSESRLPYTGNAMKYLPLTQNQSCYTQAMPWNTCLLLRIKAAIHRQCHVILASYSESKLLYTGNAMKYLPLTQNHCCYTQAMPWNTYLLLRIKAAIHRQCHEILTPYSESKLLYTGNAMKYSPLTQNQSCYTQAMPWNTCLLLRITAGIHRQCHEIFTSYSESKLLYTGNAMKYLPLTQNQCCYTQAMPWNTYLPLRTITAFHRECHGTAMKSYLLLKTRAAVQCHEILASYSELLLPYTDNAM